MNERLLINFYLFICLKIYEQRSLFTLVEGFVSMLSDQSQCDKHEHVPSDDSIGICLETFVKGQRSLFESLYDTVDDAAIFSRFCVH